MATVTVVTGEVVSEVVEGEISGETVAVVTASGAEAAMATTEGATEEDRNAASAKLLIIEVPTCGLI